MKTILHFEWVFLMTLTMTWNRSFFERQQRVMLYCSLPDTSMHSCFWKPFLIIMLFCKSVRLKGRKQSQLFSPLACLFDRPLLTLETLPAELETSIYMMWNWKYEYAYIWMTYIQYHQLASLWDGSHYFCMNLNCM